MLIIVDEPNKPNEIAKGHKVSTCSVAEASMERNLLIPFLKDAPITQTNNNYNKRVKHNKDDELDEEIKENRPLQTESIRRMTGAARQYTFDSKPIIKRLRSQTAIKEPNEVEF